MLLGEQLGGHHERRLCAAADRARGGGRGDHSFAATDIALYQPRHGLRAYQIGIDFTHYTLLGRGEPKGQRLQQPRLEWLASNSGAEGSRRSRARSSRSDTWCASSSSKASRRWSGVGRWSAWRARCPPERRCRGAVPRPRHRSWPAREPTRGDSASRSDAAQPSAATRATARSRLEIERAQCPIDQHAAGPASGRSWPDRSASESAPGLAERGHSPVFRVHHLEPGWPAPHLAVAAQQRAHAPQGLALGLGEIKEPQRQRTGAIRRGAPAAGARRR